MVQIMASLTIVIYDRNMFIVEAAVILAVRDEITSSVLHGTH
jgi:hypothetical protein